MVIAYVLTHTSLMLFCGRLGDRFGRRLVFGIGLVWSTAAFVGLTLAPTFEWLLAARVAQGVGAALIGSCGPALITSLADESRRARMLGLYMFMFGVGAAPPKLCQHPHVIRGNFHSHPPHPRYGMRPS